MSNTSTNLPLDILQFRDNVSRSLNPKLYALKAALNRLELLKDKCREAFLIKLYGKKYYNSANPKRSPKYIGRTATDMLVMASNIARLFLQATGKNNQPYSVPNNTLNNHTPNWNESIRSTARHGEEVLLKLIQQATQFYDSVNNQFLLDITLSYADCRKMLSKVDGKLNKKGEELMLPSAMVDFLNQLLQADTTLGTNFISAIATKFQMPILYDSMVAGDLDTATKCLTIQDDWYGDIASSITSIARALKEKLIVFETLDSYTSICKSVDDKFYLNEQYLFSLKWPKGIIGLMQNYCLDGDDDIETRILSKQTLFTPEEYGAIRGCIKQDDINRQLRVQAPPAQFANNPKAFVQFFRKINHNYVQTSEPNFMFQFSMSDEAPADHGKIVWLKGVVDLKCFIEVLYPGVKPYTQFEAIFRTVDKENLDLGRNPIECRKEKPNKDKLSADESRMAPIRKMINDSLTE